VAVVLGRPTPDPGLGAPVELHGCSSSQVRVSKLEWLLRWSLLVNSSPPGLSASISASLAACDAKAALRLNCASPSGSKRWIRRRTVCGSHCSACAIASTRSPSQLCAAIFACRSHWAGSCRLPARRAYLLLSLLVLWRSHAQDYMNAKLPWYRLRWPPGSLRWWMTLWHQAWLYSHGKHTSTAD
jgi:hypothetical protein